ncbi:MAG TPA: protein kinase [Gemmatimonadales bacterium]|nr:protein kinase [Gemmatimonadales bacterium]
MPELQDQLQTALRARYHIEREVGRGGMATVYRAEDLKHHRPVAVKVLHPHLTANLGAERFLREIGIAARLSHPHILTLIDSGEADGLFYYVMPFVQGESLRERLAREGRLPVEEALEIARRVGAALAYAHAQGIVHRDVKPENVMLHEGEPMVTDFGIAKAVHAGSGETLTQTGASVGTPTYMSPEQAAGTGELDARSDEYSLACMLYEMLAGEPPFTGVNPQALILKHVLEPAPAVRAGRPEVPEPVERALARALAKAPEERFPDVRAFTRALAGAGVTTPSEPAGGGTTAAAVVPAGAAATIARSIAVLPFVNMSADPENEYFTDGIAEEIINALTKIQALRVASRTSAFAFKGKNEDIGEIGRKLKVATVLEGSVRKAGSRLRVTAQLVNVADGFHLWSERYDRQLEDVFAIQDEIAESIVRALRVVLSETERKAIEEAPPADVQAYDYYLRGRQFFHQFRRTGIQFARRMFERAIEIDPQYARAYAGAADCCSFLYMYWDASRANLEGADSYSRKALELKPDLAEAHASRGLAVSLSQHYDEAEREFETAIRLNPNLFEAHYFYARAEFQQGKWEKAVEEYRAASRVRPEDYQAVLLVEAPLRRLGRTDEARATLRRAVQVAERHLELNPDDPRALYLAASALMQLGERERATDWAARARALDPEDPGVLYNVACVEALGGKVDEAIADLDRAVANGFGHREWLENDTDLDPLRGDPRFQALLHKL